MNLHTLKARGPAWNPDSSTAEVATLQLEFNQLSHVSGDRRYSVRREDLAGTGGEVKRQGTIGEPGLVGTVRPEDSAGTGGEVTGQGTAI